MKKIFWLGFILCVAGIAPFAPRAGAVAVQRGGRPEVYYRDGARFALEGRLTEAANAFEEAVALDPTNGNAYYSLGNVYTELGRLGNAVAAYRQAVSLNKDDAEAYNGLGIALGRQGQYLDAAASFERAIKIYPKWGEPHYHLSQVRRELRQDARAQNAYNEAIRLRPDYAARPPRTFATAATNAVAASSRSEKPSGVVAPDRLPANIAPASSVATDSGASAARATPATPSSEVARLSSMDAMSYYDLGLRKARAGSSEDAVVAFRQAILMDRKSARAHLALGDAYAALGKWRESVDAYEQAARLNPDDAEIYQRLGRSYAKLRETTPAPESVGGPTPLGVKVAAPSGATADAERPEDKIAVADRGGAVTTEDGLDPTAVYRVGPGDVLDIRALNGRERQTTSNEVTPTGLLDFPSLSEPVKVAGLTTGQVAARLGTELKLRSGGADPEIAVGVREYVSHAIIIGGMVKDAGTKILQREGVPLYVIIAYAQPLAGAGQALLVSRATGRSTAIDLSDARAMKTLVGPGDVITVRALPKQFFYIAGAVRQPGRKEFHAGLTLTQALLATGETLSPGATVVALTRQSGDGRLATTRYKLGDIKSGKTPDPSMQPGDRVEVLR